LCIRELLERQVEQVAKDDDSLVLDRTSREGSLQLATPNATFELIGDDRLML
jgi:hypothetical protein